MNRQTSNYFVVTMNARRVFPYIATAQAKNPTAAKRAVIEHLQKRGFIHTRSTPGAYTSREITAKQAMKHGVPAVNYDRPEFSLGGAK